MSYTAVELEKAALLTIDVQNDFVLSGAPAEIPGTLDILPNLQRLVEGFRKSGLPIFHMVRFYLPDGSNAERCRRHTIASGKRIVAPDTAGAELVDQIKPTANIKLNAGVLLFGSPQQIGPNEWVIYKPRWGAFYNTPLSTLLEARKINSVVVAGGNFPNCPRATVYEASERDYRVALVTDAVSQLYDRALAELRGVGVDLMTAGDCLCRLSQSATA